MAAPWPPVPSVGAAWAALPALGLQPTRLGAEGLVGREGIEPGRVELGMHCGLLTNCRNPSISA